MAASIEPGEHPGTAVVLLDGRPQSAVDLDDPTRLVFDYVRRTADLLDLTGEPGAPLRVLHVGGAGLSLPRYVAATRPGSRQVVLEPDAALVALVRERLPLPRRSGISVREEDGRLGTAGVRDGWAQAVVVDAFAEGEVPDALLSLEAWREVARATAPGGRVVLNLVDRAPFGRARAVVAGMREALGPVRAGAETATWRGRREGNLLLVTGDDPLPAPRGTDHRWLGAAATSDALGGGEPLRDPA